MLDNNANSLAVIHPDELAPVEDRRPLDFMLLVRMLFRHWRLIAVSVATCITLALVYVVLATPLFMSSATVLLDTRMNQFLQKQNITADSTVDTGFVDSQVEVVTSESIALDVIRKLSLTEDREFVGPPVGALNNAIWQVGKFVQSIKDALGSKSDDILDARSLAERNAVDLFLRRLSAKRVGLTYVLDVSFQSEDPVKAAKIANEVCAAYIAGELTAQLESNRNATSWLQTRLNELKSQAGAADEAVQKFKSANNIVDTSRGLLDQQQLADLNSQLITAKAATAEAKARLDRLSPMLKGDLLNETVMDALNNQVIMRLRAQYLDKSAQEAEWSARFGKTHQAAAKLRSEMTQIKNSIGNEVQRIADAYRSEYQIAQTREKSLTDSLNSMVNAAGTNNLAQVKLRQLESSADAYRTLYDSFLQKYQETTQQQTSPVTDIRVITAATPPLKKNSPKTILALAGGLLLGLFAGCGVALGRELTSDVLRSPQEAEHALGMRCLGVLPRVTIKRTAREMMTGKSRSVGEHVVDAPFSRFAETLRNVKLAIDLRRTSRDMKVVGVVSSLPKEGKTTVACNLASLVAAAGNRTLLVDCDLHQRSLSAAFAPDAREGLLEALANPANLPKLVVTRPRTGLDVLPCVAASRPTNAADVVGSPQMDRFLSAARDVYDYVFIEFAPIVPVVDAKAAAAFVDAFVLVVEWDHTKGKLVTQALSEADVIRERLAGAVLNKADPVALKRLDKEEGKFFADYYVD